MRWVASLLVALTVAAVAVECNEKKSQVLGSMGIELYSVGMGLSAVDAFGRALLHHGNNAVNWKNLAIALFSVGREDFAVAAYNRVRCLDPVIASEPREPIERVLRATDQTYGIPEDKERDALLSMTTLPISVCEALLRVFIVLTLS